MVKQLSYFFKDDVIDTNNNLNKEFVNVKKYLNQRIPFIVEGVEIDPVGYVRSLCVVESCLKYYPHISDCPIFPKA